MTLLLDAVLIAIGVHVSIRTVAALYRIIDLWYTIRTAYPRVLGAIAVWTGMIFVLAAVLPDPRRAAFFWGLVGFVPFYVSLYVLRPLVTRRRERVYGNVEPD